MYCLKKLGIVLALVFLFSLGGFAVTAFGSAPEGFYELPVINSGFEDDGGDDPLPGWLNESVYDTNVANPEDYNYAIVTDEIANTGSKSLLIYDCTEYGTTEIATNAIPNEQPFATKFTGEIMYYMPSGDIGQDTSGNSRGSGSAYAQIRFYHANGALRSTKSTTVTMNVKDQWTRAILPEVIAPQDASFIKIVIYNNTLSSVTKVYIDDVRLYKAGEGAEPEVPNANIFNRIPLINSGFEEETEGDNIPGWLNINTAFNDTNYYEVTNEKAFYGNNSLHAYDGNYGGGVTSFSTVFYTAEPGDVFKADFKAFLNTALSNPAHGNTSIEPFYAKIVFYNESKVEISTTPYKKLADSVRSFKDNWIALSMDEITAPSNTAFVQLRFYTLNNTKGELYLDGINFYSTGLSEAEPEPIEPDGVIDIVNWDFSEPLGGNNEIIGWSPIGTFYDEITSYSLSDEQSKVGTHSLKITDDSTEFGIEVGTPLIKAHSGATYYVRYSTFNYRDPVSGRGSRSQFALIEYDGQGNVINRNDRFAGATVSGSTEDEWEDIEFIVKLLPETRYIRLAAGCSPLWMTFASYFDNIELKYIDEGYVYVGDVSFKYVDNSDFIDFEADKEIEASIDIINKVGTELPIFFAVGVYDVLDNRLIDVGVANNSNAVLTDSTLDVTFTIPNNLEGKIIKVMVWGDGDDFMKPYYLEEKITFE